MQLLVFGEVLFDCFPDGEQVLGGAPFNVAWHLQALNDQPRFISRIGRDALAEKIEAAMCDWGMVTSALQHDPDKPTGVVEIRIEDNEPHYTINPGAAYDYIAQDPLPMIETATLVYHGTLALRNAQSRQALDLLLSNELASAFLDVNLRAPWWEKQQVLQQIERARWVKLNDVEFAELFEGSGDLAQDMEMVRERYGLELLVVTQGEKGATACNSRGECCSVAPGAVENFVDTVGAGDAFTAILIHGLLRMWPLQQMLEQAQAFAASVVGIRGATPADKTFYRPYL